MPLPAYRAQVYESNGPARMSDLARQRGAIEADTTLRRANAIGTGIQQVGEIAGQTMRVLAQEAENKPKRDLEKMQVADATKTLGKKAALEDLQKMTAGMEPEKAIAEIRAAGFTDEATRMQSALFAHRKAAIEIEHDNLKMANEKLEMASGLLASATALTDPQAQAAQYQAVLPKVREMVGKDLAAALPDAYDPNVVNQALTWGMTAKDAIQTRANLAKTVAEASEAKLKSTEFWQETGAKWLATATDEADWRDGQAKIKAIGGAAAMDALAMFGNYSPEAVQRVKEFVAPVQRPATASKPGDDADMLASYAAKLGKTVGDLTFDEKTRALGTVAAATRAPKDGDSGAKGLTAGQRANIEQWKGERLAELEANFAEAGPTPTPEQVAKHESAKRAIQTSYEQQLNGGRPATGTMGDIGRNDPPPPAPPAPLRPVTSTPRQAPVGNRAEPPADVKQALLDGGPGEYDLSDGTVWKVLPNGQIQRVK